MKNLKLVAGATLALLLAACGGAEQALEKASTSVNNQQTVVAAAKAALESKDTKQSLVAGLFETAKAKLKGTDLKTATALVAKAYDNKYVKSVLANTKVGQYVKNLAALQLAQNLLGSKSLSDISSAASTLTKYFKPEVADEQQKSVYESLLSAAKSFLG